MGGPTQQRPVETLAVFGVEVTIELDVHLGQQLCCR
jgi:hypothetical protein